MSESFVSTGHLAPAGDVRRALDETYADVIGDRSGANSPIYRALAAADPEQFGLCVVGTDGQVFDCGDALAAFAMMSVAKPFTFALVCAHLGAERARDELGVNATGQAFNAVDPVLVGSGGRTNPMVNAGAIATCSRLPGPVLDAKWDHLLDGISAFAGRRLAIDETLYDNVSATNFRNREITAALHSQHALACEPDDALELYSRQSCLLVTAHDLAVMGATLADGGRNPVTGAQVIPSALCHHVLAVMATSGMYERSGEWLYDVGLPAKSGIGGGIVTVSPGKGGLGSFSPRLDVAGNSVRGVRAAARLAAELGLGLFASRPV
ncbi:MAG TPA: glutaminase A [Propionicimonas sp.]|nr:glutaminase A [Propionicimonas sp.]HRA05726.1 glutaminase A [Propionicimonas sp.]